MNQDLTISDEMLETVIHRVESRGLDGMGRPCTSCRHYGDEHLVNLGPLKLCMAFSCDCGRRALMALARTLRPFWAILLAGAYFGAHIALWAIQGFPVRP